MDIELLSKMVKELILDNDKVVLPGLGSFVAEIVPSTFSDKGYTINPPYRRLYFRSKPDEGEALAEFYAKSNGVELQVAERIIRDFLVELKEVLHVKKTVVFPELGRLRATKENNIFFVADENLDIYPDGFGLEPVSLKTHQETREEVRAAVGGLKSLLEAQPAMEGKQTVTEEIQAVTEEDKQPEVEETQAAAEEIQPVEEHVEEPAAIPESTLEKPEVQMEPSPEPEPQQEPEAQQEQPTEPQPEPVQEAEPEPQPEPQPAPEPEPEPLPEPQPEKAAPQTEDPAPEKPARKPFLKALLVTLATAAVLLVAFAAVGRLCPELLDSLLYTPEELEILNHK